VVTVYTPPPFTVGTAFVNVAVSPLVAVIRIEMGATRGVLVAHVHPHDTTVPVCQDAPDEESFISTVEVVYSVPLMGLLIANQYESVPLFTVTAIVAEAPPLAEPVVEAFADVLEDDAFAVVVDVDAAFADVDAAFAVVVDVDAAFAVVVDVDAAFAVVAALLTVAEVPSAALTNVPAGAKGVPLQSLIIEGKEHPFTYHAHAVHEIPLDAKYANIS